MSWSAVRAWRDHLRSIDAARFSTGLSAQGARAAWTAALDTLTDEALEAAAAVKGAPHDRAVFVAARTVFTAPIEWCAVLLGRGTQVVLKHPVEGAGAAAALVEAAQATGLPLSATNDRAVVQSADLVLAMGSDETISALEASLPPTADRLLFGHRFSAAWVSRSDPTTWSGLAEDLALHDSRGCLSPQIVFTSLPLAEACDALATAMTEVEVRLPRGWMGAGEAARIRARGALARVLGVERVGPRWAVHGLPADRWRPEALPRCVAVVSVPDADAARAVLEPWSRWLSTVATDGPDQTWFTARICAPGRMQRPPLDRLHDGVSVLRATIR